MVARGSPFRLSCFCAAYLGKTGLHTKRLQMYRMAQDATCSFHNSSHQIYLDPLPVFFCF